MAGSSVSMSYTLYCCYITEVWCPQQLTWYSTQSHYSHTRSTSPSSSCKSKSGIGISSKTDLVGDNLGINFHKDMLVRQFYWVPTTTCFWRPGKKSFNWAMSWENLFLPYANNKGADQPAHPGSLISTFVVHCLLNIIYLVSIFAISWL